MMHDDSRTVLFDGICHLCNAAVRFIIKRDPEGVFRFAPMQSDIGRALIEKYHGSGFEPDTILLIKNGVCHEGSDAVLEILKELPRCGFRYRVLKLTPKPVRDALYKMAADNRYRLFGRRERCLVPTDDIRSRFLD